MENLPFSERHAKKWTYLDILFYYTIFEGKGQLIWRLRKGKDIGKTHPQRNDYFMMLCAATMQPLLRPDLKKRSPNPTLSGKSKLLLQT